MAGKRAGKKPEETESKKTPAVEEHRGAGGPLQNFSEGPKVTDTRMIERAISKGWPIPPGKRQALIDRQILIATNPRASRREATSAFRAIVAADKINLELQKLENPSTQVVEHHHSGQVNLVAIRQELLSDDKYLEFLRLGCVKADSDAGGVRADGESGTVEAGPASAAS